MNDQVEYLFQSLKKNEHLKDSELVEITAYLRNNTTKINSYDIKEVITELLKRLKHVDTSEKYYLKILKLLLFHLQGSALKYTITEVIQYVENDFEILGKLEKLETINNLYLLDIVLSVLENNEDIQIQDFEVLFRDSFHQTLIDLVISSYSKNISTLICVAILPKLINITKNYAVMTKLWSKMLTKDECNSSEISDIEIHDDQCISKTLTVLCILADHFLINYKNEISHSVFIITDKKFWSLIYCGMINMNYLIRKKAIYLSKRTIDYLENSNPLSISTDNFIWDLKYILELKDNWTDIFIILETLEEKQVHLVLPVLPLLIKLFSNKLSRDRNKTILLHDCWLHCICQRIFSHDSNTVVKWGLIEILSSKQFDWSKVNVQFINVIIKTLNNSSLFVKTINNNELSSNTTTILQVELSMQSWFNHIATYNDKFIEYFFNNLIHTLSTIMWAPVPLFYVIKSLSCTPNVKCLNNNSLEKLKYFVKEALTTQNVYIRGGIQCLIIESIIKLTNTDNLNIKTISNLLSVFKNDECFKRNTQSWFNVVNWLTKFINKNDAQLYLHDTINGLVNGSLNYNPGSERIVVLLYDANVLSFSNNTLNNNLSTIFTECYARSYINIKAFDNTLLFLINVIKESQSIDSKLIGDSNITRNISLPIYDILKLFINDILLFIRNKLNTFSDINDFDSCTIYFETIYHFSVDSNIMLLLKDNEVINSIILDAYNNLVDQNIKSPFKKYFAIIIISWYFEFNSKFCYNFKNVFLDRHKNFIESYLLKNNNINEILFKHSDSNQSRNILTRNDENLWKKIICEYVKNCWILFDVYLTFYNTSELINVLKNSVDMKTLLNYGFEAIEIGGRNIVLYVNNVFKKMLPFIISATEDSSLIDVNTVIRFISISWESCFELRKLEVFWKVYNSWIEMVFQQEIIINSKFTAQLVQYIDEIFKRSESVSRLTNVLISHLHQEITVPSAFEKLAEVLINAIIFGPVHRKDLRIENETCLYIKSHGDALSVNVLKPLTNIYEDSEVRLKTLDLIIKLSSTSPNDHERDAEGCFNFMRNLIRQLIEHDNFINSKKQRYFNDSLHHRVKNRILQSLLLFQHLINIDSKLNSKKIEILHEEIINWVSNNLSKESHQPSVRYQLEWLLIRCILSLPQFIENFWNIFVKGSEERAGSVCSFISVAYHLAALLNKASFTERCIEEILPWCMAQNFNIRLYSQVALIKLFELYTVEDLPLQYKVIKNSLTKSIKQGTAVRNAPKLMSDFYFNVFHQIKHFSLKSLFCDMPRLSSISHDECITDDNVLINCFTNTLNHGIVPLYDCLDNSSSNSGCCKTTKVSLSECEPASWTVKVRGSSKQQNVESDAKVIQKKFVPWNVMEMEDDETNVDTENNFETLSPTEDQSSIDNNDGLIIIASLIDRPPNLGGLSRTCEVFNVKQLVLNSLQYVKDKQFTSLSMSSEKHINITEVKQHHLKDYLLTMKQSHNYYLVGAEQTATGVKLNEFKFPIKTIVLLGNEKEGIPADLLPLLDICVEVPQFGVIRSLNVHVTGAIFVWEYAKQHKYKS